MAKKVTINGNNLLSSLSDDWGGVNATQTSQTIHGTTVPSGAEWGINRGEVERFIKSSINAQQSRVGYCVCNSAASTAAKAVVASGYQLAIGGCVRIKMTNTNTANNVTLNINSTGSKSLYYDGAQASATNTWKAGEVLEVYYDGTQYQCASSSGGRFATGEKVRDTSITDEVTENSEAVVTSGAVAIESASIKASVGYYECNTAAGTAAKTVAATGYKLVIGGNIRIKMTYANTANDATLNINSTGAKALYYYGERAYSLNSWEAGEVLEIYYDGEKFNAKNTLGSGSGRFATGEKLSEVNISNDVTDSDDLVTGRGIENAIDESLSLDYTDIYIGGPNYACPLTSVPSYDTTKNINRFRRKEIYGFQPNHTYVIKGSPNGSTLFCFLTQSDGSNTESVSITSDNIVYTLGKNEEKVVTTPSDAKIMCINVNYDSTAQNRNPVFIHGENDYSTLCGYVYDLQEGMIYKSDNVDITNGLATKNKGINAVGAYVTNGSHKTFACESDDEFVVTAGESDVIVCFKRTNNGTTLEMSLLHFGTTTVSTGNTMSFIAPSDAVCIAFSISPSSVVRKRKIFIKDVCKYVDEQLHVPISNVVIPSARVRYNITVDGSWTGNSTQTHVYIPVLPGERYRITGTTNNSTICNACAFLTEAPSAPPNSGSAPLTSDGKCYSFTAGSYVDITAPSDAQYLIINTTSQTADITPIVGRIYTLEEYLTNEQEKESIFDLNPDVETRNKLVQLKRNYNVNQSGTSGVVPLTLIHLSDIHGDKKCWDRMIEFKTKYRTYIDDAICTGDIVSNVITNDKTFLENGGEQVMLCLGNHDVAKSAWNVYDTTAQECFEGLFQPYISQWGVTYQENKCYYYKDYATQKIRLIVIDASVGSNSSGEHWNSEQLTWMQTTLESARTNGYSVIVANHYWAINSNGRTYVDCTFTCKNPLSEGESIVPSDARSAVQSFIDNGGTFICWLSGHTHRDFVYYPTAYPKQLGIVVDCAAGYNSSINVCDEARIAGTKSIDAFNVYAFDTTRKIIKIVRIGSDRDSLMRHKGTLTIKYGGDVPEVIFND